METIEGARLSTVQLAAALLAYGFEVLRIPTNLEVDMTIFDKLKHWSGCLRGLWVPGLVALAAVQTGCAHPVLVEPSVAIHAPGVHAVITPYPAWRPPVVVAPPPVVVAPPPVAWAPYPAWRTQIRPWARPPGHEWRERRRFHHDHRDHERDDRPRRPHETGPGRDQAWR